MQREPADEGTALRQAWRKRRLRVLDGVILHYGDVAESERNWFGPVPETTPQRSLQDCAVEHLPPELLRGAALAALELEQRLRMASVAGIDFARRRQLVVFDRFLARIAIELGAAVTLKGGLAVELRFGLEQLGPSTEGDGSSHGRKIENRSPHRGYRATHGLVELGR